MTKTVDYDGLRGKTAFRLANEAVTKDMKPAMDILAGAIEPKLILLGVVTNAYGDPEAFAERGLEISMDLLQTLPIGTKIYIKGE